MEMKEQLMKEESSAADTGFNGNLRCILITGPCISTQRNVDYSKDV